MSQPGQDPAVVHARPNVKVLDTRAMEWEPHPGIPGGRIKVLTRHPDGTPFVIITWVPPGLDGWSDGGGRSRILHRTSPEYIYVLGGSLPVREYDGEDDRVGVSVDYQEGYYLERSPESWHGIDVPSETGFTCLEFLPGPVYPFMPGSDEENVIEEIPPA
jgi:hypothetical protein